MCISICVKDLTLKIINDNNPNGRLTNLTNFWKQLNTKVPTSVPLTTTFASSQCTVTFDSSSMGPLFPFVNAPRCGKSYCLDLKQQLITCNDNYGYFQNCPAYVLNKFYHRMCFTQLHRTLHKMSRGSASAHLMQRSVQKSVCGQFKT